MSALRVQGPTDPPNDGRNPKRSGVIRRQRRVELGCAVDHEAMADEFRVQSIGYVRSSHHRLETTPIQSGGNAERGRIVLLRRFAPGLRGLEGFDFAHVLTLLDRIPEELPTQPGRLLQVPFLLQDHEESVGVFACRHPVRPNRIGLSLVRVIGVSGRTIRFAGVDLLDGTPVLDVKPWTQGFDVPGWPNPNLDGIRGGWYERRGIGDDHDQLAGRRSLDRAGVSEPGTG